MEAKKVKRLAKVISERGVWNYAEVAEFCEMAGLTEAEDMWEIVEEAAERLGVKI